MTGSYGQRCWSNGGCPLVEPATDASAQNQPWGTSKLIIVTVRCKPHCHTVMSAFWWHGHWAAFAEQYGTGTVTCAWNQHWVADVNSWQWHWAGKSHAVILLCVIQAQNHHRTTDVLVIDNIEQAWVMLSLLCISSVSHYCSAGNCCQCLELPRWTGVNQLIYHIGLIIAMNW